RAMPGGDTSVRDYMDLPAEFPLNGSVMPLHPHDAILQWWLELGVVGAALGTAIFAWVAWHAGFAGTLSRAGRAGARALLAAARSGVATPSPVAKAPMMAMSFCQMSIFIVAGW